MGRREHPVWQAAFGAAFALALSGKVEVSQGGRAERVVPLAEAARRKHLVGEASSAATVVADAAYREVER